MHDAPYVSSQGNESVERSAPSREDRKDLLGHKSGDVTTDYSVAELSNPLDAAIELVGAEGIEPPTFAL
ncbi:MAG: hypothetical protein WDO68_23170 [Gammaproteobacteria bacterium]